jgi:hypothetical protein
MGGQCEAVMRLQIIGMNPAWNSNDGQ